MSNRYSRITPSQFNPLGLQEIMMVPLAKQNQHDQVMAKADELGLFDINALDRDKPLVDEFTNSYREKLDELTDNITQSGIDNMSKTKLRSLISERSKWLNEGDGKRISDNYSRFQSNKEQLDKLYESGKISRDKYDRGIQNALNMYKGVAQGDTYSGFNAVHDVDFFKKAKDVASAMSNNPTKITQFSGLKYNPTTGKYVDVKTNREFTEPQAIRQAVRASLKMDTDVMSDLNQRSQLGMLGNASVDSYIDGIGILNEAIYAKNNRTSSKQYVGMDHKQLGTDLNDSSFNHVLGADKVLKRNNNNLINSLDNILDPNKSNFRNTVENFGRNFRGQGFAGMAPNMSPFEDKSIPDNVNNLPEEQKEKFNTIYNNLVKTGKLNSQIQADSPEALKEVRNYLKSIENFRVQSVIHTDGLVRTYNGVQQKMNTSTPEQLAKGISLQPERVRWLNPETGKLYNKFADIKGKYKEELLSGNGARVSGVMSPRNTLQAEYGKTVPKDILASMYEVQFSDGTKLLASRTDGERAQRSYRVDVAYNDIWYKTVETPGFDIPSTLPGVGEVQVRRPVEQYIDPSTNKVVDVEVRTPDGKVRTYSEDAFETMFKALYGVK